MSQVIQWPGIVQYDNNDELDIVASQHDLDNIALGTDNRLIDYHGAIYSVQQNPNGGVVISPTGSTLAIDEAVQLARKHMSTQDQCCVAKFNAQTIQEVIDTLVASIDL